MLLVFAIGLIGVGFAEVQGGGSSIVKSYFASVGKADNTRARTQLWKAAEIEIRKSPWIGSLWTGNFTVSNRNRAITIFSADTNIEPHNDYLEALVLGGIVGLFLFGGLIISTNVVVIRRVRQLDDEGAVAQRDRRVSCSSVSTRRSRPPRSTRSSANRARPRWCSSCTR